MSSRARLILIIAILAVVLVGGGFAVWFFGFRQPTVAFFSVGGDSAAPDISWLDCGPEPSAGFEQSVGGQYSVTYTCTNNDTADHEVDIEEHTLDLFVWNEPTTGTCLDQSKVDRKSVV